MPPAHDIAMVFQNYALYLNMTVEENMTFGLKMSTNRDDEADVALNERMQTVQGST